MPVQRSSCSFNVLANVSGQDIKRAGTPLHWHFYSPRGDSPQSVLRKEQWVITANWDTPRPGGRFDLDYIEFIKASQLIEFKLFNIISDPSQSTPLNAEYPHILQELSKELIDIHKDVITDCPDRSQFSWTSELENIVDSRYPKKKE